MNKNIEDYLHLYLGCEGYTQKRLVKLMGVNYSSELKWFWQAVNSNMKGVASAAKDIYSPGFSPILRPLSDMTDEEMHECGNLIYDFSDEPDLNRWKWSDFDFGVAEQFHYLLKKHFDLFGLIESGLAIDKTKLNETNIS